MAIDGTRRPFRFGVQATLPSLVAWQQFARKLEDLGYATLVVDDHFDRQLAPFPALMAAAAVTSCLRLGPLVLNNDLRHPAVMAREAASVDLLTNGRLELGLGAGSPQTTRPQVFRSTRPVFDSADSWKPSPL